MGPISWIVFGAMAGWIASPRDPNINSAITCAIFEGKEPEVMVAKAWERNIVIVRTLTSPIQAQGAPVRPDLRGVRVSAGFYNTEEDLERFLELARDLAR